MVKKTAFEKVGYFDSRWENGESIDWLFKAKEAGLNLESLMMFWLKEES